MRLREVVREYVVHVPAVECSSYHVAVATAGDEILRGCRCARCGGARIKLTSSWVTRGFTALDGRWHKLAVVLARCQTCAARERVLPCDALPGKVHSVGLVLGAVLAVEHLGRPQGEVAREVGVSRQLLRSWCRGLAVRAQDLFELQRHRALVARLDTPRSARLVRFAAFRAETQLSPSSTVRRRVPVVARPGDIQIRLAAQPTS